jgi:O-antigen/teichoic acid export membrane protein
MHQTRGSLLEGLLKGGGWAISARLTVGFGLLAVNALVARLLTPGEVGAFFLIASLVTIGSCLSEVGLVQAVVRLVSQARADGRPDRARGAIRYAIEMVVMGALAVGVLVWVAGPVLGWHLVGSGIVAACMPLAALWIGARALRELLAQVFLGLKEIRLACVFSGALTAIVSAAAFGLAWLCHWHFSLKDAVAVSFLCAVIPLTVAAVLLAGRMRTMPIGRRSVERREVWSVAWPLFVATAVATVFTQADIWIVAALRTPGEVALYGAASRLASLISIPLLIANAVTPPFITEFYWRGQQVRLERLLRSSASVASVSAGVAMLSYVFVGRRVLGAIYGGYYRDAYLPLVILGIGNLVNVGAGSCAITLAMTGGQKLVMKVTLASSVLAILSEVVLLRGFGLAGAAVGVCLGVVIQNVSWVMLVKAHTGVWSHASPRYVGSAAHFVLQTARRG